jgi:hypothetical protein
MAVSEIHPANETCDSENVNIVTPLTALCDVTKMEV